MVAQKPCHRLQGWHVLRELAAIPLLCLHLLELASGKEAAIKNMRMCEVTMMKRLPTSKKRL